MNVVEDDELLAIGAFARRARLSQKALRLYDRQGLLPPDRVDPVTGYRYYRASRLAEARLIVRLRGLDMPLATVAEVLALPGEQAAEAVAGYWESVERRLAAQRELAAYLRIQLSGDEGMMDMYEIQQREVREQLVLIEQRNARPEDLPTWIPAATDRLVALAAQHGGVFDHPFVVYHGEVTEDSDGPVEVCVPIDPARAAEVTAAHRIEPAHREAYTRITKAQVQYPQILAAYDAVHHWIGKQGLDVGADPREVYFADWGPAGPADEVCDIAFPIGVQP
ncbi:MerR family transcriptional regulator [Kitasatospora paracochleata]|uniref:DNA-binding transcriptional MerR regulator n=1 Tax=Kitasatospora paracochleata TaxID=58354 RepID=A0ABT1IXZ1_9ACTN|nr:MerR family transcriptional regulator [Kitasatospora paracochleata]MCP2310014.1 DNA-binding transcriptional MerR regulator [Kitasatospora paracochleata]